MRPAERIKPVESSSGVHQSGGMAQLQAIPVSASWQSDLSAKPPHQMKPRANSLSKLTSLPMAESTDNRRDSVPQV
jgi:hypothetical protein